MKIYTKVSSVKDTKKNLSRLDNYCKVSKLHLNLAKYSVVYFTMKRCQLLTSYALKDQVLPKAGVIRDLGVYHDAKLLFDVHIEQIISKASKALGFII